jgi:hypothetical protein
VKVLLGKFLQSARHSGATGTPVIHTRHPKSPQGNDIVLPVPPKETLKSALFSSGIQEHHPKPTGWRTHITVLSTDLLGPQGHGSCPTVGRPWGLDPGQSAGSISAL